MHLYNSRLVTTVKLTLTLFVNIFLGMLNSIPEIIEAIGGNDAVAKVTGVSRSAVSNWRLRGMIPAQHWLSIAGELSSKRALPPNPAIFFKSL
jgi:hypothetical protein